MPVVVLARTVPVLVGTVLREQADAPLGKVGLDAGVMTGVAVVTADLADDGREASADASQAEQFVRCGNLIREGKTFQIPSIIQTAKKDGMQLLDQHLIDLLKAKMVNPEEAYRCAVDKKQFEQYLTPA